MNIYKNLKFIYKYINIKSNCVEKKNLEKYFI